MFTNSRGMKKAPLISRYSRAKSVTAAALASEEETNRPIMVRLKK